MADAILDQVKALTDGSSVEIAKVKINDVEYTIKAVRGTTEGNDLSGKDITITKADWSDGAKDDNALKTIINEVKIGGTSTAPTIDATNGKGIDCPNVKFGDTVEACTDITLPTPATKSILDQVKALTDGGSVEIAKVKINSDDYKVIFLKKNADANPAIDNVDKAITITKKDAPTDNDALKTAISAVKIGGTSTAPTIDATNGKSIECPNVNFGLTTKVNPCTDITLPTPATKSILDQVKALTDGGSVEIAKVKINSDDYKVIFLKKNTDANPAIDNVDKAITITKKDAPTDNDALKTIINEVKIGGISTAPTIDAKGTAITCYADFAKVTDATNANCDKILFVSQEYQAVATEIIESNKRTISTDNLKILIKEVLKVDSGNSLKANDIVNKVTTSKAGDAINNAAKALCPSADLAKINADDFKDCVATAFKGYVTMNKILTNLPNMAKGILKEDGSKFVNFESDLKDDAFKAGQFYFDFTTPICAARPFISGAEVPSDDVKNCLDQVNTVAYVLLNANAACGSANKGDLTNCYKAIADTGLKTLYTTTPDALLVDFSADYPDVLDN